MRRSYFTTIICLLLLGSAGLFAAEAQNVARAGGVSSEKEGKVYEYELAAELGALDETGGIGTVVAQLAEEIPGAVNQLHGQPLPGTLLSILLAGLLMKGIARLRRRSAAQKSGVSALLLEIFHRFITFVRYFQRASGFYGCCWEWQQTVLRL